MAWPLRIVVADDERPARQFLADLVNACDGVEVVGLAASGTEALHLIETARPHLALLDLQMPELGGLEVARRVPPPVLPLIAFVTAFDDHAIEAFELNAIDYLLKPVQKARLAGTLARARERLHRGEPSELRATQLTTAAAAIATGQRRQYAERLPVRMRDDVVIVPVRQVASIVAEGELLHITTLARERYTITYRLHALEARLDPRRFVRLGRGAIANIDAIVRVSPMPGGTYLATLSNGQDLQVSRIQSRALRDTLLKL